MMRTWLIGIATLGIGAAACGQIADEGRSSGSGQTSGRDGPGQSLPERGDAGDRVDENGDGKGIDCAGAQAGDPCNRPNATCAMPCEPDPCKSCPVLICANGQWLPPPMPIDPTCDAGSASTGSEFACGDVTCNGDEFCIEVHSGPGGGPASHQCGTMGACGGGCGCALASAPPGMQCSLKPASGGIVQCGLVGGRPALICSTQ